jgi:hypothetical protein
MLQACPPELLGAGIDSPKPGDRFDFYGLEITGWAVAKSGGIAGIDFLCDGVPIGRAIIEHERPDIVQGAPAGFRAGFKALVGLLGTPLDFQLEIAVTFTDGHRIVIGGIGGSRTAVKTGYDAQVQPLLVSCIGRSGTTWLMRVLSEHPEIVAHRLYPYEVREGTYWMHMLRTLGTPADHAQSGHVWHFHENHWVGHPPDYWSQAMTDRRLRAWYGGTYVEDLAAFCQRSTDQFYLKVAEVQGEPKPKFFVEKHLPIVGSLTRATSAEYVLPAIARLFRETYPGAREILLMRDFRDRLCSIKSFNQQNNAIEFGRQHVNDDEQFVWRLRREAELLLDYWKANAEHQLFLRYEDLILEPEASLERIYSYVGVDSNPATIEDVLGRAREDTPELIRHRTAGFDPTASVARWRRDLAPELMGICQQALSDVMQEFGYAA